MIGPAIPDSAKRSTTPEAGHSIGPGIPADYAVAKPVEEEEEEEDDYVPELPPDLAAQRTTQKARVLGPSFPPAAQTSYDDSDDDDDDDGFGPMPLPAHLSSRQQEKSGVEEFLEREKRRQQAMEVRDVKSLHEFSRSSSSRTRRNRRPLNATSGCWCLHQSQIYSDVRPSGIAFSWLGKTHTGVAIDPTRLTKGRKFAPSTNPNAGSTDTSLWTETPAERQQRLADELSGKKRRKENSDVPEDDGRSALEARKRQKTEYEIQMAVSEHNVRGFNSFFVFLPRSCR